MEAEVFQCGPGWCVVEFYNVSFFAGYRSGRAEGAKQVDYFFGAETDGVELFGFTINNDRASPDFLGFSADLHNTSGIGLYGCVHDGLSGLHLVMTLIVMIVAQSTFL